MRDLIAGYLPIAAFTVFAVFAFNELFGLVSLPREIVADSVRRRRPSD